jgi:hypothetical protein
MKRGGHHRIEPLDVPDLEDQSSLMRKIAEHSRLFRRFRERFFHEHMLALFQ